MQLSVGSGTRAVVSRALSGPTVFVATPVSPIVVGRVGSHEKISYAGRLKSLMLHHGSHGNG